MARPLDFIVLYGDGKKIEEILWYIHTYGVEMCDLVDTIHYELYKEVEDKQSNIGCDSWKQGSHSPSIKLY